MRYNCCQLQPDVCPKYKICKPIVSLEKPWKRFLCECPPGYHGEHCEKPITSCQGYSKGSRMSGMYKVLDSAGSLYEVYCHFDSDGASWALVQSFSFANRNHSAFKRALRYNFPYGENALSWEAYRMSHPRMTSIENDTGFIRFTFEFEKNSIRDVDYLQGKLASTFDVISFKGTTYYFSHRSGKIGSQNLNGCKILLHQAENWAIHAVRYTDWQCKHCRHPRTKKVVILLDTYFILADLTMAVLIKIIVVLWLTYQQHNFGLVMHERLF